MWSNSQAMNISRKLFFSGLVILALGLNACSGLTKSDKPAMKTWWLEPYTEMTPANLTDPVLLNVSVTVVPGLDTDRILTLSDKAELNHFSGASWADDLPELLTSLSVRSLESSGRFEAVSALELCHLDLEIQEFFAQLDSSGQANAVRIAVAVQYQCEEADSVPLRLNASISVHDNRMSEIVAAFQQALDNVMRDLLRKL